MGLLLWFAAAVAGTAMVWKASGVLESSSERLAGRFGIPEAVRGSVIVAVGSSFPELSAAVLATIVHGEFELGVAAIVGSAIFNILAVPGLSGIFAGSSFVVDRGVAYREALFYALSVAVMALTFALSVVYHPHTGDGILNGELTPVLVLFPLGVYALYVFVQSREVSDGFDPEASRASKVRTGREIAVLAGSLAVILFGVELLVRAAVTFGDALGTPGFLWGATVVAAGTSLPDGFVSVRAARRGAGVASMANVLGSNVFDLLVCVPAGVLLAGGAVVNFDVAAPLMFVLLVATVALFVTMRTGFEITAREGAVMLVLYAAFVAWIGMEATGVVDSVPGMPPAAGGG